MFAPIVSYRVYEYTYLWWRYNGMGTGYYGTSWVAPALLVAGTIGYYGAPVWVLLVVAAFVLRSVNPELLILL